MINHFFKVSPYLLVIAITLLFSSCGDNKDECENVKITGRWEMSSSSTEILLDGTSFVDYLVDVMGYTLDSAIYASAYPDILWSIEFKSDNTFIQTYLGDLVSGTYSLEDNGNLLILNKDSQNQIDMEVISLSKDALLLTYRESGGLIDFNEDGEFETLEFVYSFAFERK